MPRASLRAWTPSQSCGGTGIASWRSRWSSASGSRPRGSGSVATTSRSWSRPSRRRCRSSRASSSPRRWPGDSEPRSSCSGWPSSPRWSPWWSHWTGPITVVIAMMVATYTVGAHTRGQTAVAGAVGLAILLAVNLGREIHPDLEVGDIAVPAPPARRALAGRPGDPFSSRARGRPGGRAGRAGGRRGRRRAGADRARPARRGRPLDRRRHPAGAGRAQDPADRPGCGARGARCHRGDRDAGAAEMRRLVGVLRQSDDGVDLSPPPSLRHLDALVDRVREAGLPVELTIEGTPIDLAPGIDLSAYRIVQEALTNALAHAGPATANVHRPLWRRPADARDRGHGRRRGRGPSRPATGSSGMRERVSLYQGRLETDVRPGGGFVVRARLPLTTAVAVTIRVILADDERLVRAGFRMILARGARHRDRGRGGRRARGRGGRPRGTRPTWS